MQSKVIRTPEAEKQLDRAQRCLYLRCCKPDGTPDTCIDDLEDWWVANRKDAELGFGKDFGELLNELDAWLTAHRPAFLKEFNGPIAPARFKRFERSTGLVLPEDYKLLLGWRDGQVSHWEPPFHPFDHQTLMSFADTKSTMEMMNELVKTGAIDETHWCRSWLPFTADILGNHTCMDLSPENYGEILLFDHELDGRIVLFNDLSEWLAELLDKLQYLDVEVWEREGC